MTDQHDTLPAQCQASCEAPLPDGFYLCPAHGDQLVDELLDVMPRTVTEQDGTTRQISGLAEDLLVTMTRQSRMATGDHGSRSAESPLPWNDRAACAELELKAILAAWCSETAQIREDDRDPLAAIHWSEPGEMAGWLKRNVDTARRHDMAGTMFAEVCDAITEAKRAVDQPVTPSPFGVCGAELEEAGECEEFLYGNPNRATVSCGECGAKHSVAERMQWMQDHCYNLHGTPQQLVSWLRVFNITTSDAAIRAMASRGRFPKSEPHSDDDNPRYRLTDVIKAMTSDKGKHRHAEAA